MARRWILVLGLAVLSACANLEPAGRNAARDGVPSSAPVATPAPAPPPASAQPAPQPSVAAPEVAAPEPTPAPTRREDNEIIVPGAVERQVPAPGGDPRSRAQRMEDVRRWDQCVMEVQSAFEADPMRPQLDQPEDYCSRALGMADRLAVPESRRR